MEHLKRKDFNVCVVYLLDSQVCPYFSLFFKKISSIENSHNNFFLFQFVTDVTKYISGCLASLSAMVQLELPHVNILSKMDLVPNKKDVEEWVIFTLCFLYFIIISFLVVSSSHHFVL